MSVTGPHTFEMHSCGVENSSATGRLPSTESNDTDCMASGGTRVLSSAASPCTDAAVSVHGDAALLSTRVPPEAMQSVSFDSVLGRRPVALLFSTPQLCISKVCGPVTDI